MAYFLIRVLFVLFSFHRPGHATRFLPMIVWDHINPLLSCKCNWLTIPKILTYDRVDFVCPTLKVAVKLLDGYSRPGAEMNENLFRRKWPGTVDGLRSSIKNGSLDSFCDPDHGETNLLYTCRGGAEGKSFPVTFKNSPGDKPEEKYDNGIYVFFNNGDSGKLETLNSKVKKCTMVFAVEHVSRSDKVIHDMSYGKCLNPDEKQCKNTSVPCRSVCNPEACPKTAAPTKSVAIKPTPSSQISKLCSSYFSEIAKTQCPTPTCEIVTQESTNTAQTSDNGKKPNEKSSEGENVIKLSSSKTTLACSTGNEARTAARKTSDDFKPDHLGYGIIIGFALGCIMCCVCFTLLRVQKGKGRIGCCGMTRSSSIMKHNGDNFMLTQNSVSFDNKSFALSSPSERNGEAIPTQEKTWPSAAVGSTDRLTSVESSGCNTSTVVKSENKVDQVYRNKGSGSFDSFRCQSPGRLTPIQLVQPTNSTTSGTRPVAGKPDKVNSGRHAVVHRSPPLPPINNRGEKSHDQDKRKLPKTKTVRG